MPNPRLSPDANAVIDRMRDVAGVRTDIALCSFFGLGTSVVSNWRQRARVPYPECVILALRKDVSLDWLILGIGERVRRPIHAVGEDAASYGDPRMDRMVGFLQAWQAGHDDDDMAWLERTLARSVPEYGEWLAARKER